MDKEQIENEELEIEESGPIFPEKYTDDDGKRHSIEDYQTYLKLVENEIIHPNTLVHDGKNWNYHARYANPDAEDPNKKDKFANMWNRMR